jgi:hypothetical protein
VTLEAFLSRKPVVTCADSGGTLEFVVDGENGFVCAPEPESIGRGRLAIGRRSRSGCAPRAPLVWHARSRSRGTGSWSASLADPSTVSIVIPALNEEHAIGDVVAQLRSAAPWREIIVVDDGSADTTGARAAGRRRAGDTPPVQQGQRRRGEDRHSSRAGRVRPHRRWRRTASAVGCVPSHRASRRIRSGRRRAGCRDAGDRRTTTRQRVLNALASHLSGRPIPDLTSGFRGAAPRAPARVPASAAKRFLHADHDDARVHQSRLQRDVRAD